MKWLFSKPKPETQPTALVTPPRPSAPAVDMKKTQVIQIHEPPSASPASGNTVPVELRSILDQFPTDFLSPDARVTQAVLEVPADLIVPQLGSGKITLPLRDVVKLLPVNLVVGSLTSDIEEQPIRFPMHEIIGALPPEVFQLSNQSPPDLNSADFEDVPRLFDDSFLAGIEPETTPVASTQAAATPPAPSTALAPKPEITTAGAPVGSSEPKPVAADSATPSASDELPASVHVKLRNLVAVLPDKAIRGPRAELLLNLPADARVAIPTEWVLPLLSTGKIRLPVSKLVSLLPAGLLTTTAASIDDHVMIPIEEIVSQLPASAFRGASAPVGPPNVDDTVDGLLFEPFTESGSEEAVEVAAPVPSVEPVSLPAASAADELAISEEEAKSSETAAPLFDTAAFLAKLNRITADELAKVGLSRALVKRILEQRAARTQFRSLDEVRQIPGFTRKAFETLAGACPETLNRLLGVEHDQELSLRDVVRLTAALPGVAGCALASMDGLVLTAHLPGGLDENRLSAFAPQLFRKINDYTEELGVGDVQRLTLFTDRQPVSIFRAGGIYLVIVHDPQHFSKALLRRLTRIGEELARLCRMRAVE